MEPLGAKGVRLVLLDGMVRQNSYSAVGHFAEDMLRQLSADKLFLAVDAFDLDFGPQHAEPGGVEGQSGDGSNCVREK